MHLTAPPASPARAALAEGAAPLPGDLATWVSETLGTTVASATRLPGGNRRQAWLVDLQDATSVFLRYDPQPVAESEDPYSLWREAEVCAFLHAQGVLLPGILAVHPLEQAVLVARADGDAAFGRLRDEQQRTAVARHLMHCLADLHAVAPAGSALLGPLDPTSITIRAAVELELARWERMYRSTTDLDPLVEFALLWLRANLPDPSEAPAVVHGDSGPGNFLFSGNRVTAVIDWELAHVGDPMEDLAWLALRTAQEGFPNYGDRLDDYRDAGGRELDVARLRYHLVFAELRVVILRHRALCSGLANADLGNSLLSAGLHRRLCTEALAAAAGFRAPDVAELQRIEGAFDWVADAMLTDLRSEIVPRSTDPIVVAKAKGLARGVKALRRDKQLGQAAAAAELSDLTALLGPADRTLSEARQELAEALHCGESLDAEAVLTYLSNRAQRENEVLADALGALSTRHHPELDACVKARA